MPSLTNPSGVPASSAGGMRQMEMAHARVLALYLATGLGFMLLPGTYLGVWNLLQVSARHSVSLVSPAWLQAHGHAQVFGWVGTFILGIGFYSMPLLRPGARPSLIKVRLCWALWTAGVALRWMSTVYEWHWRVLLPVSAALEFTAFAIFFVTASPYRLAFASARVDPWARIVIAGAVGFALTVSLNVLLCAWVASRGTAPEFPHGINQRFLAVATWGFLAPFVWGFSSKWLPVLLGLRPIRMRGVLLAVAVNAAGVLLTLAGWVGASTVLFVAASVLVAASLRLFEPSAQPAKTRGVHRTFPLFVRFAYVWLLIAAIVGVAAARWDVSGGIWGASRHAFTVGFVSVMVFSIGQRVLPAFAAIGPLWSPRLMFAGLLLLTAGCVLRVVSEIVAYQAGSAWAWSALPVSALVESAAVTLFAINMVATFMFAPEPLSAP